MAKHPTNKKRQKRQKLKGLYSKLREEAQLHGLIATTPEGAVRQEVVDPLTQESQKMLPLERRAIRNGWEVPEEEKHAVVDRLLQEVKNPEASALEVAVNAKALLLGDQKQYERDHPDEAGRAKGKTEVNVAVVDPFALYKRALEEVEEEESASSAAASNGQLQQIQPSAGADSDVLASSEVVRQREGTSQVNGVQQRDGVTGGQSDG